MRFLLEIRKNKLEELVKNKTKKISQEYPYNYKGVKKNEKDVKYLKLHNYLVFEYNNSRYEKNKKLQKVGYIATLMKGL